MPKNKMTGQCIMAAITMAPIGKVAGAPRNWHCTVFPSLVGRSPNVPTRNPASRLSFTLSNVSGRSGTITVPAISGFNASRKRKVFVVHDIHKDFERIFRARHTERAQHFKATKVRAEQD